jgi:hypothetical protein
MSYLPPQNSVLGHSDPANATLRRQPVDSTGGSREGRRALVVDDAVTTVRLEEHRGDSDLGELDLGEDEASAQ